MKKILFIFLSLMLLLTVSCTKENSKNNNKMAIAMIVDANDVMDGSFNQFSFEACNEYSELHNIDFRYFKPSSFNAEGRVAMLDIAIEEGYNVIICPGFLHIEPVLTIIDEYPDIIFVLLDGSEEQIKSTAKYLGKGDDYQTPPNLFVSTYKEEIGGFLVGYAAVKEGFTHLGFLGGMGIPPVIRYGVGYTLGADTAAREMGIADQITVEYVNGGIFYPDPAVTAAMDSWYQARNVEVVFCAGGTIYVSACEAARKVGGKIIGVDVDQSELINKYGENMCVTCSLKSLRATVFMALDKIANGTFSQDLGGRVAQLGLVSDTDLDKNFVGMITNPNMKNFSEDDYKNLVKRIYNSEISIHVNENYQFGKMKETHNMVIKINEYKNIK